MNMKEKPGGPFNASVTFYFPSCQPQQNKQMPLWVQVCLKIGLIL